MKFSTTVSIVESRPYNIYGDIYESRRFVRVRNNVCLGTGFWYTGQCLQNRMIHNSIHLFDIHEMRIENYEIVIFTVYSFKKKKKPKIQKK